MGTEPKPTRPSGMRDSPEFNLIAAIRDRLAERGAAPAEDPGRVRLGPGDDAAITMPGGATATSVDAVVDGVHFRSEWCPPMSVGRKAMAAALSDLAAMGAAAGEAYVWLGRPDWLDDEGVLDLCDGLAVAAARDGVVVAGGDLTRASELAVSVTVVGHSHSPEDFVGRGGAQIGDVLCVSGPLGGAAAGLMVLEHPELTDRISAEADVAVSRKQLDPHPRLEAGRALAGSGARAMIDISDGLGADAEQLAAASGLAIEVELTRVPVAAGVEEVAEAAGRDPYELLTGGEDYELLAALPRQAFEGAAARLAEAGGTLVEIGRFAGGRGVRLRLPGGRSLPAAGYDQISGRSPGG